MTEEADKNLGRRQFLTRMGKAGISIAAAGTVSYMLYDDKGPQTSDVEKPVRIHDFSVTTQSGKTISVVRGTNRVKTVNKAVELLGGI